MMGELKRIG